MEQPQQLDAHLRYGACKKVNIKLGMDSVSLAHEGHVTEETEQLLEDGGPLADGLTAVQEDARH